MALALKINHVAKSFGKKFVLKDISLELKEGEIVGLVGKSGCGKSTLLKILVGYLKADKGEIFLNDNEISEDTMALRRIVGYTTQENSFYEKLTILENMRYYGNIYRIPRRIREERIELLLNQVKLYEHRNSIAGKISGGMKRRLDFAISLIHNPKILILDEPTTGLDPLLIDQFWRIVIGVISKGNKTALMSSHILPEIEQYCTKAAVINNGHVIKVLNKKQMKNLEQQFKRLVR